MASRWDKPVPPNRYNRWVASHLRALRVACVVYALALVAFAVWCWADGDWGFALQVGLPNMFVAVNLFYLWGVTARSVTKYDAEQAGARQ